MTAVRCAPDVHGLKLDYVFLCRCFRLAFFEYSSQGETNHDEQESLRHPLMYGKVSAPVVRKVCKLTF